MGDRKEVFYILGTVILLTAVGLYLALNRQQDSDNWFNLPFTRLVSPSSAPTSPLTTGVVETPVTDTIEPTLEPERAGAYAVVETNQGNFEIYLLMENAPNTVANFLDLAEAGYYNDTSFHRFVPELLLQGGSRNTINEDPADDALGGPGYVFPDEVNWDSLELSDEKKQALEQAGYSSTTEVNSVKMDKYRLAMANSAPDSNGSQFFIILTSRESEQLLELEGKHTVFAEITSGRDLIDKLANLPVNLDNLDEPRPSEPIVIKNISTKIK